MGWQGDLPLIMEPVKVIDRPKNADQPGPIQGGAFVPDSWTCATCGKSDPLVQGVFQHRCILEFSG